MAAKKRPGRVYASDDPRIDDLLNEVRDLKQMVGQLAHNLELMRGEKTSFGSKPYTGTKRPEDLPADPPKRLCPKCYGSMRWVRNNNDGSIFAGCRQFPDCRGTRKMHDAQDAGGTEADEALRRARESNDESNSEHAAEENDDGLGPGSNKWGDDEDAPF